jgi:hypothetical protein
MLRETIHTYENIIRYIYNIYTNNNNTNNNNNNNTKIINKMQGITYLQDISGCLRTLSCTTTMREAATYLPGRFATCGSCSDLTAARAAVTQKRIQHTVCTAASDYALSLVPQHVYDPALIAAGAGAIPWNQASDRAVAGVVARNVPSRRTNSAHSSITRARPGACSAPGKGVDIKHGSYDRYLAKLKGRTVGRSCIGTPAAVAVAGNKTQYYSVANSSSPACSGIIFG